MSGLHHSVAQAFSVSGTIREKGYYKTRDQTRMIRKAKEMPAQILERYHISEHCIQAGYPWMERYHLSKSGQPYVQSGNDYYIMTDLIRHREADFSDPQEFLQIVEAIAHWHTCARSVDTGTEPRRNFNTIQPLSDVFLRQGAALESIRKRVGKHSRWSDFDVLFLKNYQRYKERIQGAQQLLESTGYLKRWNKARQMKHICHGGLKEDCLRISGKEVYITKLEHASYNYQLNDLCSLIRRRERREKMDRALIYEAYSKNIPLEPEEEIILEAMLLYPTAFVKIVMEYYQKKRSWTPAAMANKMKEVLLIVN